MSFSPARRTMVAAGSLTLAAAVTLAMPAPAQAAAYSAYGGSAYGSTVKVGSIANSGKTSYVPLCTTYSGKVGTNNTAALDLPQLGHIGAVTTRVSSNKTRTGVYSATTTKTAATSLLGGLVKASAITTSANVSHNSTGYHTSGSSVLVDLRIAGVPVAVRPGRNTVVPIPGVATVTLNGQSGSSSGGYRSQNVTALRIDLLNGNPLGLPAGVVVVGHSNANLHSPTHRRPYGSAYGTKVDVAGVLKSGATASVVLPCGGSSTTRTNNVVSGSLGSALHVRAVRSTAKSSDSSKQTVAATTNKVAGIDLLGGTVHIDAVEAKATTTRKGSKITSRSSAGTKVVGLTINGVKRSVSTKENTRISILGVGTLYLHRAVRTSTSVQVYAVQLKLLTAQSGLESGAVITVGSAKAGVSAR